MRATGVLGILMLGAALGSCTTTDEAREARMYVSPGQYDLFDCPRLEQRANDLSKRERELRNLMAMSGNAFINNIAYRNEYLSIRGQLGEIEQVRVRRSCPPIRPLPEPLPGPSQRKERRS